MKIASLKNFITILLILITAGAVFFCLTLGTMSAGHISHGVPAEDSATSHILHSKELTLATIVTDSLLALISFVLLPLFAVYLFLLYKLEFFVQNKLLSRLRFRKRHFFSKIQTVINSYLSLFVRSPEYIKST